VDVFSFQILASLDGCADSNKSPSLAAGLETSIVFSWNYLGCSWNWLLKFGPAPPLTVDN
jgi:hypothetical protein